MAEFYLVDFDKADEYYCYSCKQLRLNATGKPVFKCKNCGSTDIVIGEVGTLDRPIKLRKLKGPWE